MKVYIDQQVQRRIDEFYDYALQNHDSLDEITVLKKVERLYDALETQGKCAGVYSSSRLKKEWTEKEYREFICEDFHFAYQIYRLQNGEDIVRVHDVCHSLFCH